MGWGAMFIFFILLIIIAILLLLFGVMPKIGAKFTKYFKWEEEDVDYDKEPDNAEGTDTEKENIKGETT